jgi:hypothetical protein
VIKITYLGRKRVRLATPDWRLSLQLFQPPDKKINFFAKDLNLFALSAHLSLCRDWLGGHAAADAQKHDRDESKQSHGCLTLQSSATRPKNATNANIDDPNRLLRLEFIIHGSGDFLK